MEPKTATLMRVLEGGRVSYFGDGLRLYRCSPPMPNYDGDASYEYVVASSVNVPFSGPETYLFGANESGDVSDWCELPCSRRGSWLHDECFSEAGYEVVGA